MNIFAALTVEQILLEIVSQCIEGTALETIYKLNQTSVDASEGKGRTAAFVAEFLPSGQLTRL